MAIQFPKGKYISMVKVGEKVAPFEVTPASVAGAADDVVDAVCPELFFKVEPVDAHSEQSFFVRLTLKDFPDEFCIHLRCYAVFPLC